MQIEVLKSKIHCATVTEANINYMGSITIDADLLDARISESVYSDGLQAFRKLDISERAA